MHKEKGRRAWARVRAKDETLFWSWQAHTRQSNRTLPVIQSLHVQFCGPLALGLPFDGTLSVGQLVASQCYISKIGKQVKPQITTMKHWLATRDIRNTISLFCVASVVFYDPTTDMWILGFNKSNADVTSIRFGYQSNKLRVVIPDDTKHYREVELVTTKKPSLPHQVKYASPGV